jgi:hypothetical protein
MVERNTGSDPDTPRIWERRYDYPTPERNDNRAPVDRAAPFRRLQRMRVGYESDVNQAFAAKFRSDFSNVPVVSSCLSNKG